MVAVKTRTQQREEDEARNAERIAVYNWEKNSVKEVLKQPTIINQARHEQFIKSLTKEQTEDRAKGKKITLTPRQAYLEYASKGGTLKESRFKFLITTEVKTLGSKGTRVGLDVVDFIVGSAWAPEKMGSLGLRWLALRAGLKKSMTRAEADAARYAA